MCIYIHINELFVNSSVIFCWFDWTCVPFNPCMRGSSVVELRGFSSYLICSVLRWKFRALTRVSSVNGALSLLRWRSKWAELEKAWTPVSVLLETYRVTGLTGLSFLIASCSQTKRILMKLWVFTIETYFSKEPKSLVAYKHSNIDRLHHYRERRGSKQSWTASSVISRSYLWFPCEHFFIIHFGVFSCLH